MTKQEVLNTIKEFSEEFPREALKEIQANRENFTSELLDSLDYVYHNSKELIDDGSDYFLHTYAMYLLAEFKEKQAFPLLINLLKLPEGEIDLILGDTLTNGFARLLLCTYDSENIQMLLDVIENQELYEWARVAAVMAYTLLVKEELVTRNESVSYLRKLIYDKLPSDDSYLVFTEIAGCVLDARLVDMIPDVRFLYDDDRVDTSMYGDYDDFLDYLFEKEQPKPSYINDAISEMAWWACFKRVVESQKRDSYDIDKLVVEMRKDVEKDRLIVQKQKKVGRNDPCPCGSGKKYKKCCMAAQQSAARLEDEYDLLKSYPKDSDLFEQMYEKEAVEIDMLVYKVLHHRAIPIWVQRNMKQERIGKIEYLNEALTLFLDKCLWEQITSFSMYDDKFMVHYHSREWVSALIDLIEDSDSEEIMLILQKAKDVLQKYS